MANNIMGSNNRKSVETPEIVIKGNIMTWKNTMLQLSNVSSISTAQDIPTFPGASIALIVLGFLLFNNFKYVEILQAVGIILIIFGIVPIVVYAMAVSDHKYYLSVTMNSGICYNLVVKDKKFLKKMLDVLEQIIIDGGVGNRNYTINIQNSTLGDLSVMNNTRVR